MNQASFEILKTKVGVDSLDKRKVIVREIETWRKSKILPERYCDFLLNLYQEENAARSSAVSRIKDSSAKPWILTWASLLGLFFITLYFEQLHLSLQLGLSAIVVLGFIWFGFKKRDDQIIYTYISFAAGAVFMLFIGRYLLQLYELDAVWFIVYVLFCSCCWVILGIVARMGLFQFCGWAGMLIFYGWIVYDQVESVNWFMLQLCWLPLSAILIWVGWLLHVKWVSSARAFLGLGLLAFFAAEIYGYLLIDREAAWIQTALTFKFSMAGTALFFTRHRWIEWLRGGAEVDESEEFQERM